MKAFFEQLQGMNPDRRNCSVTVVSGPHRGEKMLLLDGKPVYYSHPGGFLASTGKTVPAWSESGLFDYSGVKIYHEILGHAKKAVVLGCGHVAIPVIKLLKLIGFQVTAIDDRPVFVDQAKEAGADEALAREFDAALQDIDGDTDTYFIIVTRGHKHDEACLREILKKEHAYIGMMGSKRRIEVVRRTLFEDGISRELVDSLYSPIGLNIHAQTPEEIAVSVVGEIIEVKSRNQAIIYPEIITDAVASGSGRMILCSIVARSGSAPRDVGSKMLMLEDGTNIGTIGGGLMEAKVIEEGRRIFAVNEDQTLLKHVALNADTAADEGEVCGGELDVLLEPFCV